MKVLEDIPLRPFTVEEYHRMAEADIFAPDERVELIRGGILGMSPKGRRHVLAVARADRLLQRSLQGRASVYIESPLLKEAWHSEPEPDLIVTSNPDIDAYGPEASVVLVVEVADSSLEYDRTTKVSLYAEAEVPEYWIVNLVDDVLEIRRDPKDGTYLSLTTHRSGESVSPTAWPDLKIDVVELIPPREDERL